MDISMFKEIRKTDICFQNIMANTVSHNILPQTYYNCILQSIKHASTKAHAMGLQSDD
jgi:hypothetical protein